MSVKKVFGNRKPLRFWYLLSALACFAILLLGVQGKLVLYVHPRYHIFTMVMVALGTLILGLAAFQYRYKGQTNIEFDNPLELAWIIIRWLLSRGAWIVIIMLALLFIGPSAPLLSSAADRKTVANIDQEYIISSPWFDNPESLYHLGSVLTVPYGATGQEGKKFTLSGFVRADSNNPSEVLLLSRFVITCCVVDATPAGVPVYVPNWSKKYKIDEWLKVKGEIKTVNVSGQQQTVLVPSNIKKIKQPKEPYDFL